MYTVTVHQFIANAPMFNYGVMLVLAPVLMSAPGFFILHFIKRG